MSRFMEPVLADDKGPIFSLWPSDSVIWLTAKVGHDRGDYNIIDKKGSGMLLSKCGFVDGGSNEAHIKYYVGMTQWQG